MIQDYDIIDTNFRKLNHPQFQTVVLDFAETLETHEFWKHNWADFVAGSPQFREHVAVLKEVGVAADRGDSAKKAERDIRRSLAELDLDAAVKYMVVHAVHRRDPALLKNVPLPPKAKQHRVASKTVAGSKVPIQLEVKHVRGESGSVQITGRHIRNGGPYLLQFCKGEPTSEDSWQAFGGHYNSCAKIILSDLEPANRYFFRMRTDGPDGPGPWSHPVSIIVL